ncbi:MAG: transposase [Actinomycetia bacterium]|nr:transposase [Actinomycetes bacterium]
MNVDVGSKPTTRRYSPEQKEQAVRMVFALREELGTKQGTVKRVADQLGIGIESVRGWVKQAEIDRGERGGTVSDDGARIKALEQENKELRRANSILKSASAFFAAEFDRRSK